MRRDAPASPAAPARAQAPQAQAGRVRAGRGQVSGSSYWGPQTEAMSSGAVATYVSNCEAAFPALEVWWTSRECESISTKERRAGRPTSRRRSWTRGRSLRFPHLREFTLVNVDVDKHSFVNWDAQSLEKVHLDPVGTDTYPASTFAKRPSAASRKPIVQPLLDGAERRTRWAGRRLRAATSGQRQADDRRVARLEPGKAGMGGGGRSIHE